MKGSFYSFAALESKTKRKFHETRLLLMSDNVYCVDNDVEFNFIFLSAFKQSALWECFWIYRVKASMGSSLS